MNFFWWCLRRREQAKLYAPGGKYYRNTPVPNTRCWRPGGSVFRYPKTLQELREISKFYHDEEMKEYKVKNRAARNKTPTAWDDYMRSDVSVRNWKKYRHHQWK